MPGIHFTDNVTHVPADWANAVDAIAFDVFNGAETPEDARTAMGLGDMATQPSDEVSLTGGEIDGVAIGLNVPGQAHFNWALITELPIDPRHAANKRYVDSLLRAGGDPFVFQVGGGNEDHYHVATLSQVNAKALVNGTANQFVVTTDIVDGHTHDITIVIDRGTATMEVTNITNNSSQQHTADVINKGSSEGGGGPSADPLEWLYNDTPLNPQIGGTASDTVLASDLTDNGAPLISHNGTSFLVVPPFQTYTLTSDDGIAWTSHPASLPSLDWSGLAWNGSVFVLISLESRDVRTSADGITWTLHTNVLPDTSGAYWSSLTSTVNGFLAVAGGRGGPTSDVAAYSAAGVTWTTRTMPYVGSWEHVSGGTPAGRALAIAHNSPNVAITLDNGANWTLETPFVDYTEWRAPVWGGSRWLIVSEEYTLAYAISTAGAITEVGMPEAGKWTVTSLGSNNFLAIRDGSVDIWRIDQGSGDPWYRVGSAHQPGQGSTFTSWVSAKSNGFGQSVFLNLANYSTLLPVETEEAVLSVNVTGEELTAEQIAGENRLTLDSRLKWAQFIVDAPITPEGRSGLNQSGYAIGDNTVSYNLARDPYGKAIGVGYNDTNGRYVVTVPRLGSVEVNASGGPYANHYRFTPWIDGAVANDHTIPKILFQIGFRLNFSIFEPSDTPYPLTLAALSSPTDDMANALWRHDLTLAFQPLIDGGFGNETEVSFSFQYLWDRNENPPQAMYFLFDNPNDTSCQATGVWSIVELGRSYGIKLA